MQNIIEHWAMLTNTTNQPDFSNPVAVAMIILSAASFIIPCIIWFLRNYLRIVHKKDFENLNRSLKWVWLGGSVTFLISFLILILIIMGVII